MTALLLTESRQRDYLRLGLAFWGGKRPPKWVRRRWGRYIRKARRSDREQQLEEVPVFELKTLDGNIKIYANGLVEDWPSTWPKLQGICNHLPVLLNSEQLAQFSK